MGAAGIAANALALDIAEKQTAHAEAIGDSSGYWAGVFGQVSAIGGIVAGVPFLPPNVRALGLALNLGGALAKEVISNREAICNAIGEVFDDLARELGKLMDDQPGMGGDPFTGMPWPGIDLQVDQLFDTARAWRQPVDPLMLDLDGDGLELKRADGSILFDHNADTIRTGTGWIGSDDGILVRDLNGNGAIDSGRELFGIDTVKADGSDAVNGFDALADLDSNADGQLTAADLAWGEVKVWRDLDQDGVSDAGEVVGLDALGITRIGVAGSAANTTGGTQAGSTVNGNLIAQSASFTHTVDGVSVSRTVGAIDLESNPFYREFMGVVPLTEQARSLPDMQGSGRARDLAEAASLSASLGISLAAFSTATTRDAQRTLLDPLLTEWSQSSDFWQSLETTLDGNVKISGLPAGMTEAQYRNLVGVLEVFNGERLYSTGAQGTAMTAGTTRTDSTDAATLVTRAGYGLAPPAAQLALLQQSYDALKESIYGALVVQTRLKPYLDTILLTIDEHGLRFDTAALAGLLDQRKAADERNAILDLAELNRYAQPTLQAVGFVGLDTLRGWVEALPSDSTLRGELTTLDVFTASSTSGTGASDIYLGNAGNNSFSGGAGDDHMTGGAGGDSLDGGAGDDTLLGGDGDDGLYGQSGADVLLGGAGDDQLFGGGAYGGGDWFGDDDTLDGGAGNDWLTGGFGSDTYLFGRGDGRDTINNDADGWNGYADADPNKLDVLRFKEGVRPEDVRATRNGDNLVLKIDGTADEVTVHGYFTGDGISARGWAIDRIEFTDGTAWTLSDMNTRVLQATDGKDAITGYASDDTLAGLAGNDTLQGRGGNDVLQGGEGDDSLYGEEGIDLLDGGAGSDSLDGGAGNDTIVGGDGEDMLFGQGGADVLRGGAGNDSLFGSGYYGGGDWFGDHDTLDGGTGNDWLTGGFGSDTYLFGRGDGQDVINNDSDRWNGYADADPNKQDVLRFKEGILASDVRASRNGEDLVLKIDGTNDQVTIQNYFVGEGVAARGWAVDQIQFADGTTWKLEDVKTRVLQGTDGNDALAGFASDDTLMGLAGNDTLQGRGGNDVLQGGEGDDSLHGEEGIDLLDGGAGSDSLDGGAGNDTLHSDAGNDLLQGGSGDDTLRGGSGNDLLAGGRYDTWNGIYDGSGNDTYEFHRGDGQDRIVDIDPTPGNTDVVKFGPDIDADDLWFRQAGNDLEVSIIGTDDKLTIDNWYAGRAHQVEQFKVSDSAALLYNQVDALVAAMAAFAPPASSQISLPPDYQTALNPVIAANWK
ncbi:calcium-binding protein [Variovorax sp. KK3]|uniref:calcium-binding protein n=1 Tax=Variovorax sp. KK3 TaxID=1855728 RepID=UPI0015C37C40|nr:calcium-binding protein [Variovorax sp. KK3]